MASIVKKRIGGRFYYYIVETKRVKGQPRIVKQVYLGTPDNILKRLESHKAKGGIFMAGKKRPSEGQKGFGLGDIFKGIGNLIDLLAEMEAEGKTEVTKTGEIGGKELKGVYGFSVKIGLGGLPTIETFGNIKETKEGPVVEEVREPLVDVFDEGDSFRIIAELPGVEAGDIKVDLKDDILIIAAERGDRKYHKEVLLPSRAEAGPPILMYRNGILEVRLKKAAKG